MLKKAVLFLWCIVLLGMLSTWACDAAEQKVPLVYDRILLKDGRSLSGWVIGANKSQIHLLQPVKTEDGLRVLRLQKRFINRSHVQKMYMLTHEQRSDQMKRVRGVMATKPTSSLSYRPAPRRTTSGIAHNPIGLRQAAVCGVRNTPGSSPLNALPARAMRGQLVAGGYSGGTGLAGAGAGYTGGVASGGVGMGGGVGGGGGGTVFIGGIHELFTTIDDSIVGELPPQIGMLGQTARQY